jgi:iron-sulfur cluster assembly protein
MDQRFETNGAVVVCDPKSFLYLNGSEVDFEESLMGRGFKFGNPNASKSCGCGESFSV